LVVVAATLISLLVSFTLTPWLASRFTKLTHLDSKKMLHLPLIGFEKFIKSIEDFFRSILNVTLRFKALTLVAIFAMVFASFTLMTNGYIGAEFAANGDNGEFVLSMEMPKSTPLDQNNKISQEVEKYLLNQEDVSNVFISVGQSSGQTSVNSTAYMTEINVKLVPAEDRELSSDEYARKVKTYLSENIPGVKYTAAAVSMVGGGTAAPIQLTVQGSNVEEMIEFSQELIKEIKTVAGTAEVKSTVEGGNPEINVDIEREKLADLGLTLDVV